MYNWRKMTPERRAEVLVLRKQCRLPWHGPPHRASDSTVLYHITAACYEHASIIGFSPERMSSFSDSLVGEALAKNCSRIWAWCVLPNHYHVQVECENLKALIRALGLLHGKTSRQWNLEEAAIGRTCWHRCMDRAMRSDRHKWATLNYVHHNPVKHDYVEKWTDWPWSSADQYLDDIGKEAAAKVWKEYPILDCGKGWDD
ncbi:MAG: transposase [Verrucomicrobia bacterium]|nr:transposase [Verrucomicrobiota bacterium]